MVSKEDAETGILIVTSILSLLGNVWQRILLVRAKRKTKTIICVYGVDRVPPKLSHLKEFTSLKKALFCEDKCVLLYCRTLSYALRKGDWVLANSSRDCKIHSPDDPFWEDLTWD